MTQPEPKKDTAEGMILAYLRSYHTITPMQAWLDLGIYRLGAAIFRLRSMGYPISTEMFYVLNECGKKVRFARYHLHRRDFSTCEHLQKVYKL